MGAASTIGGCGLPDIPPRRADRPYRRSGAAGGSNLLAGKEKQANRSPHGSPDRPRRPHDTRWLGNRAVSRLQGTCAPPSLGKPLSA